MKLVHCAGDNARRKLERLEAQFEKAEGQLDDANETFNELAQQLRAKQDEVAAAAKERKRLEDELVKR